jgi:hypothetical protein
MNLIFPKAGFPSMGYPLRDMWVWFHSLLCKTLQYFHSTQISSKLQA